MTKIVYRQMPAPRGLSQQIPGPGTKARMQKTQGGSECLVQIPGDARGGWLWMKLIPALANYYFVIFFWIYDQLQCRKVRRHSPGNICTNMDQ